jgi:hypothetical protein
MRDIDTPSSFLGSKMISRSQNSKRTGKTVFLNAQLLDGTRMALSVHQENWRSKETLVRHDNIPCPYPSAILLISNYWHDNHICV